MYEFTEAEINDFTDGYPNVSADTKKYLRLAEDTILAFTMGRTADDANMKLAILHQANYMATSGATGEQMPSSWSAGSFSISYGTKVDGTSTASILSQLARNILYNNGLLGKGVRLW
jgi:hypothetical protein